MTDMVNLIYINPAATVPNPPMPKSAETMEDNLRRLLQLQGGPSQGLYSKPASDANLSTVLEEQPSVISPKQARKTRGEKTKTPKTEEIPMQLSISPLSIHSDWSLVMKSLPPFLKDIVTLTNPPRFDPCDNVWTCTPTSETPMEKIPLTIAGLPVVIPVEYHYPLLATTIPPPDPHPQKIDCLKSISEEEMNAIFNTFEHALGFYLLINGMLQIIIPDDFDYEYALSHRPTSFGGLQVSYISVNSTSLIPTAETSVNPTTSLAKSTSDIPILAKNITAESPVQRPRSEGIQSSNQITLAPRPRQGSSAAGSMRLVLGSMVQARVEKSKATERFQGKIGLMTRTEDRVHLVVSSHVLTQALTAAKSSAFPGPNWIRELTIIASNGSREVKFNIFLLFFLFGQFSTNKAYTSLSLK